MTPVTLDRSDVDTPIPLIDLDAVERNIDRMQRYCDDHGFALRPHVKTHKLPAIAQLQMRAGAVGIACQKLGEAEVMAQSGLDDILITFPLVGPTKLARLAALARAIRVTVAVDSHGMVADLSRAMGREGIVLDVLVDCDTGYGRTGVQTPAHATELAELAHTLPGLRFAGLMTFPTLPESGPWLRAARERIQARGLPVGRVSGGGTPRALHTHEVGEITELRVGTYVLGDRSCIADGSVPVEDCALTVLATVVSRPTAGRIVLDAGSKSLTSDRAKYEQAGFGAIVELPEAEIYSLSEEHALVDVSRCTREPEVGEVVTVIPNHACGTVNLHDEVLVSRSLRPLGRWRVAARGEVR